MSSRVKAIITLMAVLALLAGFSKLEAGEGLRDRFKKRYPDLLKLKKKGKVGETWEGKVEAVEEGYLSQEKVKRIIDEENADRARLFRALAKKNEVTEAVVAKRYFGRQLRKADPDEYVKGEDGKWKQRKDVEVKDKGTK